MAESQTDQALALSTSIVGALHAAGVLQPAGMAQEQTPPAAATPPMPEWAVGDYVQVQIRQIRKFVGVNPNIVSFLLTHADYEISYDLAFPPNDEVFMTEFHRLQLIERPIQITAAMTVTQKISPTSYVCEMRRLWANTGFRS